MTVRKAELCAGYGGLSASVEDVLGDAVPAWYAEYDPTDKKQHSSKILAHHWPGVPNHGDITAIDYSQVERVHVLLGGYPCQPASVAGKQLGEDDPRWLWPHVALAVRALRPPLLFFENVRNHLRVGFDTVLGDLDDAGYDVFWTTLKASAVGAPHHRDRLFILGISRDPESDVPGLFRTRDPYEGELVAVHRDGAWTDPFESLFGHVAFAGDIPAVGSVRDGVMRAGKVADCVPHSAPEVVLPTPRTSDANGAGAHGDGGPDLRSVVAAFLPTPTVADSRDSRNKTAGRKPGSKHHDGTTLCDAVVMLRAGQETAANDGETLTSRRSPAALLPTPRATDGTKGGPDQRGSSGDLMLPSVAAGLAHEGFDWAATPYAAAIERWERVLGRPAPSPVNEGSRLEVCFVEWLQGLPDGWVTAVPGLTRNAILKALGNGVVAAQGSAAFRMLLRAAGLDWVSAVEREYGRTEAVSA